MPEKYMPIKINGKLILFGRFFIFLNINMPIRKQNMPQNILKLIIEHKAENILIEIIGFFVLYEIYKNMEP